MRNTYRRDLESPSRALFFTAVMINDMNLIPKVEKDLESCFTKIESRSSIYEFSHSNYYNAEMGDTLFKYFISFEGLIEKIELPDIKISIMGIEEKYFYLKDGMKCRKVNLDPGYLTHSKVLLATSKNYSHRVYLGKGVFAELTYIMSKEGWQSLEWTYPDYRDPEVVSFFSELRKKFKEKQKVDLQSNSQ
ncbi:DUF4416 family protein [bacterium]|nr:DUF4416 family protein [bacterium]